MPVESTKVRHFDERLNVNLSFGRHSKKLCEECKALLHGTFKDQMSHFYKTTITLRKPKNEKKYQSKSFESGKCCLLTTHCCAIS